MLYLFRVISDEDKEFYRDILVEGTDSFLDFHKVLQENLNYDPSQLASFFITTDEWEKVQEIMLIDMQVDTSSPAITMEQARIDEYFEEKNQRMIYVFDFFSERVLFIELMELYDKKSRKATPLITSEKGKAPAQLMFLADDTELGNLTDDLDSDDLDDPEFISFGDDFPEPDNPDF